MSGSEPTLSDDALRHHLSVLDGRVAAVEAMLKVFLHTVSPRVKDIIRNSIDEAFNQWGPLKEVKHRAYHETLEGLVGDHGVGGT